jgi:hypothetical protein
MMAVAWVTLWHWLHQDVIIAFQCAPCHTAFETCLFRAPFTSLAVRGVPQHQATWQERGISQPGQHTVYTCSCFQPQLQRVACLACLFALTVEVTRCVCVIHLACVAGQVALLGLRRTTHCATMTISAAHGTATRTSSPPNLSEQRGSTHATVQVLRGACRGGFLIARLACACTASGGVCMPCLG